MDRNEKRGIAETYRGLFRRFIRIRGNPRQIASGFAMGVFIGMSPTMGIQILLAIFFASLLKWNKISATIGVLITNAFTAPLLYALTYFVGAWILGIENHFIFPDEMNFRAVMTLFENAPRILGAMTVGGIVVGLPLAVIAYFVAYYLSSFYQARLKDSIRIPKIRKKQ